MTKAILEKISTMSGISKRLFLAISDIRATPPQLEDALYQIASVIDSTSKYYYPNVPPFDRFVSYLDSITTDLYKIATSGRYTFVDCKFIQKDGTHKSFGEIIYIIRCSSYHDPNEVDQLIHWGDSNQMGYKDGRFIVTQPILMALVLMLISDDANIDHIDRSLFTDEHFLKINGKEYPFHLFVGERKNMFNILGLSYVSAT